MRLTMMTLGVLFALSLALVGCGVTPSAPEPPAGGGGAADPAAGMRLAPGLYDQEDGTVVALGTLERVDLEGGFWAVVDTTGDQGAGGSTVAVIANGTEFADELAALEGMGVEVRGTRFEGMSIRMAGPEIEMTSIVAVDGDAGPAE